MNFVSHSDLKDCHAFLGASKHAWINYDEEKLEESYLKALAKQHGTRLHDYACESIKLRIKLPDTTKTLNMYVNDAIGYRMTPEQTLFYSFNCFGTADAISFNDNLLRIHDLKTGVSPTSFAQLEIYAALFCLEYDVDPNEIDIELRIYQLNEVRVEIPNPEDILYIMEKIKVFDRRIEQLKEEQRW